MLGRTNSRSAWPILRRTRGPWDLRFPFSETLTWMVGKDRPGLFPLSNGTSSVPYFDLLAIWRMGRLAGITVDEV